MRDQLLDHDHEISLVDVYYSMYYVSESKNKVNYRKLEPLSHLTYLLAAEGYKKAVREVHVRTIYPIATFLQTSGVRQDGLIHSYQNLCLTLMPIVPEDIVLLS